jgi:hypothetical protein
MRAVNTLTTASLGAIVEIGRASFANGISDGAALELVYLFEDYELEQEARSLEEELEQYRAYYML